MKKIVNEKFTLSRKQVEFVYELFLHIGVWKMLEILHMKRNSKDEEFIDEFWRELEEVLK